MIGTFKKWYPDKMLIADVNQDKEIKWATTSSRLPDIPNFIEKKSLDNFNKQLLDVTQPWARDEFARLSGNGKGRISNVPSYRECVIELAKIVTSLPSFQSHIGASMLDLGLLEKSTAYGEGGKKVFVSDLSAAVTDVLKDTDVVGGQTKDRELVLKGLLSVHNGSSSELDAGVVSGQGLDYRLTFLNFLGNVASARALTFNIPSRQLPSVITLPYLINREVGTGKFSRDGIPIGEIRPNPKDDLGKGSNGLMQWLSGTFIGIMERINPDISLEIAIGSWYYMSVMPWWIQYFLLEYSSSYFWSLATGRARKEGLSAAWYESILVGKPAFPNIPLIQARYTSQWLPKFDYLNRTFAKAPKSMRDLRMDEFARFLEAETSVSLLFDGVRPNSSVIPNEKIEKVISTIFISLPYRSERQSGNEVRAARTLGVPSVSSSYWYGNNITARVSNSARQDYSADIEAVGKAAFLRAKSNVRSLPFAIKFILK